MKSEFKPSHNHLRNKFTKKPLIIIRKGWYGDFNIV